MHYIYKKCTIFIRNALYLQEIYNIFKKCTKFTRNLLYLQEIYSRVNNSVDFGLISGIRVCPILLFDLQLGDMQGKLAVEPENHCVRITVH